MKILQRTVLTTIVIIASSVALAWGQQSSPIALKVHAAAQHQPLVDFDPNSPNPFVVNPAVAETLSAADAESAQAQLAKIKLDIATLVTQHPSSPAAKEVSEILDKAGLKVIEGYGIYPKHVFCITVPITR